MALKNRDYSRGLRPEPGSEIIENGARAANKRHQGGSLDISEANADRSVHSKIFYYEAELLQRLMDSLVRPTHIYEGHKLPTPGSLTGAQPSPFMGETSCNILNSPENRQGVYGKR